MLWLSRLITVKNKGESVFYTYDQNNSGGRFSLDDMVTVAVIIEANSDREADFRAEEVGIYFDSDRDCPCCGPRWSKAWRDGTEVPEVYGQAPEMRSSYWVHDAKQAHCYVYYLNGDKVGYFRDPKTGETSIKHL